MWQAMKGKLPAGDQISKGNGPGSKLCALCGRIEDTYHIVFECDLADVFWCCTRSAMNVQWAPNSFVEVRNLVGNLSGQVRRLSWFGFSSV